MYFLVSANSGHQARDSYLYYFTYQRHFWHISYYGSPGGRTMRQCLSDNVDVAVDDDDVTVGSDDVKVDNDDAT